MIGIRLRYPHRIDEVKGRILCVADAMDKDDEPFPEPVRNGIASCLSPELEGGQGSFVVIAGAFNYWSWEDAAEFSRRLSTSFTDCEVLHSCVEYQDECEPESGRPHCQMWFNGVPTSAV
jgi:hypothetical protein